MNSREDIQIDLDQIRIDILHGIRECADRGLAQTAKWLAELNFALKDHKIKHNSDYDDGIAEQERESYILAKTYFDCEEYDRAAHFLENCTSPKCVFLHKYSQYMSSEKKRLDNATDSGADNTDSTQVLLDLISFFKVCYYYLCTRFFFDTLLGIFEILKLSYVSKNFLLNRTR